MNVNGQVNGWIRFASGITNPRIEIETDHVFQVMYARHAHMKCRTRLDTGINLLKNASRID